MDENYKELAIAIVSQAVADYRKALKKLKDKPRNKEAISTKRECEKFFRSGWYAFLTSINPQLIMDEIKREVDA